MNSISINIDEKTLEKMKKFYDSQMIKVDEQNVLFKAQMIGCLVTAYDNLEVTFEGIRAAEVANEWQKKIKTTRRTKTTKTAAKPIEGIYTKSHIGSDDIGNQDYFGPICTVACYVEEKDIEWLKSLGIENCKNLPATEVVRLAKEIKDRVIYSLLILDNPHYNKMISEGVNQAHIKAKLHNQAITNVMQRLDVPVEMKVVEHFVAQKTFYNYLKSEVIVVKDIQFEKNSYEKFLAMCCANILARYASLQYFNNMSRSLKVKLPHGATNQVEAVAVELVKARGESILNKVAKKNFPNTKRIMEILK